MSKRIAQVNTLVKRAEGQLKSAKDNYWKAAKLAIVEFEASGNLGPCQCILDSFNHADRKGVVKRSGYITWLASFGPIILHKDDMKKLVKDKSDNAVELNVKGALRTPFWDLSANNDEELLFKSDDIWKAVNNIVKRFSKENASAEDEAATKSLTQVINLVKANAPDLVS
tara:strand:- start:30071 stop:30580 length:510 start_codon:yes stop_codon:yes gene_type:complete